MDFQWKFHAGVALDEVLAVHWLQVLLLPMPAMSIECAAGRKKNSYFSPERFLDKAAAGLPRDGPGIGLVVHGPEERANGDTGGSEDVDDGPRRGRQDHGVQLLGQVREEVD